MQHLRGVVSDAFTTQSSLILETYSLCDTSQQRFSKTLQFIDINSLGGEYLFTEKISSCTQFHYIFFSPLFERYQFLFCLLRGNCSKQLDLQLKLQTALFLGMFVVLRSLLMRNWWDRHGMVRRIVLGKYAEHF